MYVFGLPFINISPLRQIYNIMFPLLRMEVNVTEYVDATVELSSTVVLTLHLYLLTLTSGCKRYIVNLPLL